MITNSDVIFTD